MRCSLCSENKTNFTSQLVKEPHNRQIAEKSLHQTIKSTILTLYSTRISTEDEIDKIRKSKKKLVNLVRIRKIII